MSDTSAGFDVRIFPFFVNSLTIPIRLESRDRPAVLRSEAASDTRLPQTANNFQFPFYTNNSPKAKLLCVASSYSGDKSYTYGCMPANGQSIFIGLRHCINGEIVETVVRWLSRTLHVEASMERGHGVRIALRYDIIDRLYFSAFLRVPVALHGPHCKQV